MERADPAPEAPLADFPPLSGIEVLGFGKEDRLRARRTGPEKFSDGLLDAIGVGLVREPIRTLWEGFAFPRRVVAPETVPPAQIRADIGQLAIVPVLIRFDARDIGAGRQQVAHRLHALAAAAPGSPTFIAPQEIG